MHPTEGLTQTVVDQTPGYFNTYSSSERSKPYVWCAKNVVFPVAAGDYLLFEMGGSGVGSAVYLTASGTLVAQCGDGGALPNAGAAVASGDVAAHLGSTADVTWEFDPVANTARLWVGESLIGEGAASLDFSEWGGSNNAGYGTIQGSAPDDTPSANWPGYDTASPANTLTLGVLQAYGNQLSTWEPAAGGGDEVDVAAPSAAVATATAGAEKRTGAAASANAAASMQAATQKIATVAAATVAAAAGAAGVLKFGAATGGSQAIAGSPAEVQKRADASAHSTAVGSAEGAVAAATPREVSAGSTALAATTVAVQKVTVATAPSAAVAAWAQSEIRVASAAAAAWAAARFDTGAERGQIAGAEPPAERTLTVEAEARAYTVASETRLFVV